MKRHIALFFITFATLSYAEDVPVYKKFAGEYLIYGGGLGDPELPKNSDRKLSIFFDEEISKALFESMAKKNQHDACLPNSKDQYRRSGDLECIHYHAGPYSCSIGLDLMHGKTILGSIC